MLWLFIEKRQKIQIGLLDCNMSVLSCMEKICKERGSIIITGDMISLHTNHGIRGAESIDKVAAS